VSAAGKATTTASFAQGSRAVQGSTDLTVTATTPVSSPRGGEGTVTLQGMGTVLIDGRKISVSGPMSLRLSQGAHVFPTVNGLQTILIFVAGGKLQRLMYLRRV
jgi:hypothetical protein